MKIDEIKINGFGKIKNKEIVLKDGINLIYGENESGKSTILKFIEAMLFGLSKNKNGKIRSDFEQYKPWADLEFSGKMKYHLKNGEKYEIFREFKKKRPVIYNEFGEDISKQFKADKTKGISFFEEQVGLDEIAFSKTAMISQQEIRLEKSDTNNLVQKISNLISTGDEQISFQKSIEKLNKMQNERIGTERTKQKPMNVVNSNIQKLSEEKKMLVLQRENVTNYLKDKEKIREELEKLQLKKEDLKHIKESVNEDKIKNIETKFKMRIYTFLLCFLIIITVVLFVFLKNKTIALAPMILVVANLFVMLKTKLSLRAENSNLDSHKIEKELEKIEVTMNDLKLQNCILENEKVNMDEKLEELAKIEECLEEQKEIKDELISLNTSFNIVKECLEEAYEEIKHNISPQFEQKLCEIVANITDEKYKNVVVNDETGLNIELASGAYMPVDRLSVGTIDEMYLSLRLSALSQISKENLPIILDESFAYFDEQRLKNILCYLQDKHYHNQIIIFTCSNREEMVLNSLKIEYHLIHLEK